MKKNILVLAFLIYCFCSNGQELTQQDFESFYKVLIFQTDKAIDDKKYDYATVYENSYRFARQHPLNDSVDNSFPDMYFSQVQRNKDNIEDFPGFVIHLDEEPEEEMRYVVHHLVVDSDQFTGEVPVSTPGAKTMQDFDLFLSDMIDKDYYMLMDDYNALMEIRKKLETVGGKYSPKVVQSITRNRVKIIDPIKIVPLKKATPINKNYRMIEKK